MDANGFSPDLGFRTYLLLIGNCVERPFASSSHHIWTLYERPFLECTVPMYQFWGGGTEKRAGLSSISCLSQRARGGAEIEINKALREGPRNDEEENTQRRWDDFGTAGQNDE